MGGGVGISYHAPIKVATDNTIFAMPETNIGYFPEVGAAYFLSRIQNNPNLGLYLALTGHQIKGKEALSYGIATHYVP